MYQAFGGPSECDSHIVKVKEVWPGSGERLDEATVDVVYYDLDGSRIGRGSPTVGMANEPTSFDPCVDPTSFVKIRKPEFPVEKAKPPNWYARNLLLDDGSGRAVSDWLREEGA